MPSGTPQPSGLQQLAVEVDHLRHRFNSAQKRRDEEHRKCSELQTALNTAHEHVSERVEHLREQIKMHKHSVAELKAEVQSEREGADSALERLNTSESEIARLKELYTREKAAADTAAREFRSMREQSLAAKEDAEQRARDAETKLARTQAETSRLKQALVDASNRLHRVKQGDDAAAAASSQRSLLHVNLMDKLQRTSLPREAETKHVSLNGYLDGIARALSAVYASYSASSDLESLLLSTSQLWAALSDCKCTAITASAFRDACHDAGAGKNQRLTLDEVAEALIRALLYASSDTAASDVQSSVRIIDQVLHWSHRINGINLFDNMDLESSSGPSTALGQKRALLQKIFRQCNASEGDTLELLSLRQWKQMLARAFTIDRASVQGHFMLALLESSLTSRRWPADSGEHVPPARGRGREANKALSENDCVLPYSVFERLAVHESVRLLYGDTAFSRDDMAPEGIEQCVSNALHIFCSAQQVYEP